MNIHGINIVSTIVSLLYRNGIYVRASRIKKSYLSHAMPSSLRCISDILDEQKVVHSVFTPMSLEDLMGGLVFMPALKMPLLEYESKNGSVVKLRNLSGRVAVSGKDLPGMVCLAIEHDNVHPRNYFTVIENFVWKLLNVHPALSLWVVALMCVLSISSLLQHDAATVVSMLLLATGWALILPKSMGWIGAKEDNGTCSSGGCETFASYAPAIALSYFISKLVSTLILGCHHFWMVSLMSLCGVFASLLVQARRRAFCSVCLKSDFIIMADAILCLASCQTTTLWHTIIFLLLETIVIMSLYMVHEHVRYQEPMSNSVLLHEHLLADNRFFNSSLSLQPKVFSYSHIPCTTINIIRDKNPSHHVLLFMSPTCRHCRNAMESLLRCEGIDLDIILVSDSPSMFVSSACLIKRLSETESPKTDVLSIVFASHFEKCIEPDSPYMDISRSQTAFSRLVGVDSVPSAFIDGRPLPAIYAISDLEYIL